MNTEINQRLPHRELSVHPSERQPTYRMITPDFFQVELPDSPEYARYENVRIRRIDRQLDPEHFAQKAKDYIRSTLRREDMPFFTWPIYKLDLSEYSDDQLFQEDGSPTEFFVNLAYDHYLVRTVDEKGNHFIVVEDRHTNPETGEVTYEVIGGEFTFAGVSNENEGWMSKIDIATEHRGKGFGRIGTRAGIDCFFLNHRSTHIIGDKSNLHLGVNIDRVPVERHHEASLEIIRGTDIKMLLQQGAVIDADMVRQLLERRLEWIRVSGYSDQNTTPDPDKLAAFNDVLDRLLPVQGYTLESLKVRKEIMVAAMDAFGHQLTRVERTITAYGAELVNGITDSAIVRREDELDLVDTRRWVIRRREWLLLQDPKIQALFQGSYIQ